MFTVIQPQQYIDDIKLQRADGTSEILHIALNLTPQVLGRYRQLQVKLLNVQKQSSDDPSKAEEIGKIVIELFQLLFGEQNTQKLLEFYDDDFVSMCSEMFGYIQDSILPQINKVAKDKKAAMKRRRNWL